MLEFFRRGVKSWVAKGLLMLLIISFAVWGIGDIFVGGEMNRTVAQVGDTEIDGQDFAVAVQRRQNQLIQERRRAVPLSDVRENGDAQLLLNSMVLDAAISEELMGMDVDVPAAAIRNAILTDANFADARGQFNPQRYAQFLNQSGFSQQSFEEETRRRLRREILLDAVIPGEPAPTAMAERIAVWGGETRKIAMFGMDAADAPDPGTPDDAALKAFFDADTASFREPERRWGSYIAIDIATLVGEMMPTEDEAKAEYDANPANYSQPATRTVEQIEFTDQAKADAAASRLITGEATFAEIAAEQNIAVDDLSLGVIAESDSAMSDAAKAAVFTLTEPGVAGPIKTPIGGYILLNVTAVELGGVTPFEEIKGPLIQALAVQRARAEAPRRANQIDDLRAGGADLSDIARDLKVPLVEFQGLASDRSVAKGDVPPMARNPRFMTELAEAADGEERDVLQLEDGSYVLVMVERIVAAHLPELDTIKDKVTEAWAQDQRLTAVEAKAADLIKAAPEGGLAVLAEAQGGTVQEPDAFARSNPPLPLSPDLVEAIFAAEAGGLVTGRNRPGSQILVVALTEITPLEGDALTERVTEIEQQLQSRATIDYLETFAVALQSDKQISINNEAVDGVFEYLENYLRGGLPRGGM